MAPTPSYKKIAQYIKDEIFSGSYNEGDRIPSENQLASLFNVSRMTARKAIDHLVYDGILVRIPGLGTYVAEGAQHFDNKHFHIGVIMDDLSDTRGITISSSITRTLLEFSIHPTMVEIEELTLEGIEKKIKQLLTYGVDGIILPPKVDLSQSRLFTRLVDQKFPIVFIDRGLDGFSVPVVESNNYQGALCLGKHLKEVHEVSNVLFFSEEGLIISSVRERFNGIKDALKEEVEFFQFFNLETDLIKVAKDIKKGKYDAIVFCHDLLAISGMTLFYKLGINIPKDIIITGFDDRKVAQFSYPPLTTVKQNFNKMGSTSALFMIKLLKGEKVPKKEKIPVKLIVRGSCGCKYPS